MSIANSCEKILMEIGEDVSREGLIDTPKRFEKAFLYMCKGYGETVDNVVNNAVFNSDSTGEVVVADIEFYSLCEHHILPFFGKCTIKYIPKGKVLGLSKFARVVDVFSRRLQVQEKLTFEIHRAICKVLGTEDVEVATEAKHLCMMMRGVQKQCSTTSCVEQSGVFRMNTTQNK